MFDVKPELIVQEDYEALWQQRDRLLKEGRERWEQGQRRAAQPSLRQAAPLEMEIARLLEASDKPRDALQHWISAASLWKMAGESEQALSLAEKLLNRNLTPKLRDQLEDFTAGCQAALNQTSPDAAPPVETETRAEVAEVV